MMQRFLMLRRASDIYKDLDFNEFMKNEDVVAFIGKNFVHYRDIWEIDYGKSKGNLRKIVLARHVNALAMLVCVPAWFGYRKMYAAAGGITALLCLATFLESWVKIPLPSSIFLVVNLLIATQTKGFYFDHVVRFFDRNKNTDRKTLEPLLIQKGGVSVGASLLWTVGLFAAMAAIAFSGEYFFPEPDTVTPPFFENDF